MILAEAVLKDSTSFSRTVAAERRDNGRVSTISNVIQHELLWNHMVPLHACRHHQLELTPFN
jgi:hypothetical protein